MQSGVGGSLEPLVKGLGAELFLSQLGGSCLRRCYAAWSLFRLRIKLKHQNPFIKSFCCHYPGPLIPYPSTPAIIRSHHDQREKSRWLRWVQSHFNFSAVPPPWDALCSNWNNQWHCANDHLKWYLGRFRKAACQNLGKGYFRPGHQNSCALFPKRTSGLKQTKEAFLGQKVCVLL